LLDYNPDVLILVDYPGFNLRIAEFASQNNLLVFYYISPQVWAWKQSRIKKIKKYIDRMFVILPFEKAFYAKHDYNVDFVGHPLLDAIPEGKYHSLNTTSQDSLDKMKPEIVLLPGSRKQEISRILRIMVSIVGDFPEYSFKVAAISSIGREFYQDICKGSPVEIVVDQTYKLLTKADVAVVTSGTATLETALFEVPEVVCYKGGYISYRIARTLVKVKYISLVNLIMDRTVVKELIQNQLNRKNLKSEITRLLDDKGYRERVLSDFKELKAELGGKGASERTAKLIKQYMKRSNN
jgi:lipid-A-disaccharide synthase